MAVDEERVVKSRVFRAYGIPLEIVTYFIYLGRVILAADNYCLAVVRNMAKTQAACRTMTRILSMEVAEPWVSGFFFKYIVQ